MFMKTRVQKTAQGWEGNSEITLGFVAPQRERILDLRTYRNNKGLLVSTASVSHCDGNGIKTHHIDVDHKGDYFAIVLTTSPSRVTEKALKNQHTKVAVMFLSIAEKVRAHYKPQPPQTAQAVTGSHDVSH